MAAKTLLLLTSALAMTSFLFRGACAGRNWRPNLLVVMVDDLGWNDIGVHDPNMLTPTIDELYGEAFRFNYSYADPVGSSSRAAFFSGNFSFAMGLQDGAINRFSDAHVPINHTILPQALKYRGYKTHLVGKWNQGFCNLDQTPTRRGFDDFYGQYTVGTDYTTKETEEGFYDFRYGEEVYREDTNEYSTELFAKRTVGWINRHKKKFPQNQQPFFIMVSFTGIRAPNDVPAKYIRKCRKGQFATDDRRTKCGMMAAVDIAVFKIMRALRRSGQLDNTVVFFTSDNGGDSTQGSSNWPLRGSKGSVWEGGIRVPSFIYSTNSSLLPTTNHTYQGMFHTVDWYPTLLGFAKQKGRPRWPRKFAPPMDGINHWRQIKRGFRRSFRKEFAYIAEEGGQKVAYVRQKDYKLVVNEADSVGWYAPTFGESPIDEPEVNYENSPYLMFNIKTDPLETTNIFDSTKAKYADAREDLLDLYEAFKAKFVAKYTGVVNSSPANHPEYNGVWSPGSC